MVNLSYPMNSKKLSELDPDFNLSRLFFICPACEKHHSIRVSISEEGKGNDKWGSPIWKRTGDSVDNLSIHPSINCSVGGSCKFHGWIKNGIVTW